jgi:hypothetical protein
MWSEFLFLLLVGFLPQGKKPLALQLTKQKPKPTPQQKRKKTLISSLERVTDPRALQCLPCTIQENLRRTQNPNPSTCAI